MVKKKSKSCQRCLGTTPNLIQEKLCKVDSYLYTTIKIVSGQFSPKNWVKFYDLKQGQQVQINHLEKSGLINLYRRPILRSGH